MTGDSSDSPDKHDLYMIHSYMVCKVDESLESPYRDYTDGRHIMPVITEG